MNSVKNKYSIKDLENLSGIKAHTIRIWEKRYNILIPVRTQTNIRLYDSKSLQKLLNITTLHNSGYKISKIAELSTDKIHQLASDLTHSKKGKNSTLNNFKLAIINLNQSKFIEIYNRLSEEKSFHKIFIENFIPLLNEIGVLWQSGTISSAHEHFVSHLIKQKIISHTDQLVQKSIPKSKKMFVLYLPENEIHDLGLLYLNYELISHGYTTLYLGNNTSLKSLTEITKHHSNVTFVTYLTNEPSKEYLNEYILTLYKEILHPFQATLWVTGLLSKSIATDNLNPTTRIFYSLSDFIKHL